MSNIDIAKNENQRYFFRLFGPTASKVSREVANLTNRKNPYTQIYGVKEFICLSVFHPNYLRTGRKLPCE